MADEGGGQYEDEGEEGRARRRAAAARGIWEVRRRRSQSTSSSMMSAVSTFWARNQRRAFRWPSQAFAAPRFSVELSLDLRRLMSSSVQMGWSGMSTLRPVSSADSCSEERKAEVLVETAIILPNWASLVGLG